MNKLWPSVTSDNPCGICGKSDWCCAGDRAWKCMRVESKHASRDGGWYHFYNTDFIPLPKASAPNKAAAKSINATQIMHHIILQTNNAQRLALASSLGVAFEAVVSVQAGWSKAYGAWAFPMRDGMDAMIGVRLRTNAGRKWAVTGSRQGIFTPQYISIDKIEDKTAFIVEGPTDLAAALSLGLFALGKPSNVCGDDYIRVALKRLGIKRVVIVSDNDDPGQLGAKKLKRDLMMLNSAIWTPPAKDLRKFLNVGGTKAVVEDYVRKLIWKKGI